MEQGMRIDDQSEADPFGASRGVFLDRCGGRASTEMPCDSLLHEAIELAHGRRHLTIVHGDPVDVVASRELSELYEELRRLAAICGWVRVRGNAEYVTVTVGGAFAEERIALFEAAAAFSNPGHWTIVASAVPPLS